MLLLMHCHFSHKKESVQMSLCLLNRPLPLLPVSTECILIQSHHAIRLALMKTYISAGLLKGTPHYQQLSHCLKSFQTYIHHLMQKGVLAKKVDWMYKLVLFLGCFALLDTTCTIQQEGACILNCIQGFHEQSLNIKFCNK